MFGMGFTEILFIAVIAVLFLGPDKLPEAMVQIAKLFKSVRSTVNEAKNSFEEEVRIKELREEALGYRKKIEEASNDIAGFKTPSPTLPLNSRMPLPPSAAIAISMTISLRTSKHRSNPPGILNPSPKWIRMPQPIKNLKSLKNPRKPKRNRPKKRLNSKTSTGRNTPDV